MRRAASPLRSLVTLALAVTGVVLAGSTGCATFGGTPDTHEMDSARGAIYDARRAVFVNARRLERKGPPWKAIGQTLFGDAQTSPEGEVPIASPVEAWKSPPASGLRLTWMGHSTALVEIDGARVLTDPIWSERASPSTLVGPHRFHAPPAPLEALPPIDAVIISHDHYDHLDHETTVALAAQGVPFFVPLGVGSHLAKWGVPADQITELDWWGRAQVPGTRVTVVATPAQHFSGRGLLSRNQTLWASWVVRGPQHRVYFGGDTGLFDGFADIGRREGPFDASIIPVGAYNPAWREIHLDPEEAIEAHRMVRGGVLLPVHWGTFQLGTHDWREPAERTLVAARAAGVVAITPLPGAPIEPTTARADSTGPWWRLVDAVAALLGDGVLAGR